MKILLTLTVLVLAGFMVASGGGIAAETGTGNTEAYSVVSGQDAVGTSGTVGREAGYLVSNQEGSDKESAGSRFEVTAGQQFNITLASNVTTGYHWELAEPLDEAMVQLVGSEYKAPETRRVGAGGQEVWTFRAVGQGQTSINLKYVRPWEKDVAPVMKATYIVIIQ